jgi:hypothetical protein
MNTKTTIYLSDELRDAVKKHCIDIKQSLSEYTEAALQEALKRDDSPAGRKKIESRLEAKDIDKMTRHLVQWWQRGQK